MITDENNIKFEPYIIENIFKTENKFACSFFKSNCLWGSNHVEVPVRRSFFCGMIEWWGSTLSLQILCNLLNPVGSSCSVTTVVGGQRENYCIFQICQIERSWKQLGFSIKSIWKNKMTQTLHSEFRLKFGFCDSL